MKTMTIKAAAEPQQIRSLPKEPRWWASSLLTTALGPRVPDHLGRLLGLCPLGDPAHGVVLFHFASAEIFEPYIPALPGLFCTYFATQLKALFFFNLCLPRSSSPTYLLCRLCFSGRNSFLSRLWASVICIFAMLCYTMHTSGGGPRP